MDVQSKRLQKYIDCVILRVGDIVIDKFGDHIGILISRKRHIDIIHDDVYVWEVKWINSLDEESYGNTVTLLEERSIQLCIVLGTYKWHSITGGTFEL